LLAGARPPLDRRVVITALGIAQILAWGTSFYFPAVFAEPIVKETGWSLGSVVGGTSIGLLTAGLISPQVGRIIDVRGGRPVLLASSLFYAAGLALVGLSQALPVYWLAWALIGFGMGTGLYDAVFAALGRMYGSEARGPITSLTLFGGFAGTVCWPLSAFMIEHFGWRNACFVYAAIHLLVMLPLQVSVVGAPATIETAADSAAVGGEASRIGNEALIFGLLAVVLSIAGGIGSIVVVHLLIFLQARGVDFATAVSLGTIFGPAQVGARLVERIFGNRYHPDLDNGCLVHADGHRLVTAVRRDPRIDTRHPSLWGGLRNFMGRPRNSATCTFRTCAISAIDGKTGFSKPDHSGLGAIRRRASA
jgi:MFS family permease